MSRPNVRVTLLFATIMLSLIAAACGDGSGPDQPAGDSGATATVDDRSTAPSSTPTTELNQAESGDETPAATATPTSGSHVTPAAESGATSTPHSLPTPRPIEQEPPPVRLRIPALGIDAVVQWVGVDSEGRMDVPSNYTDVAWYERGPSPGTPGNSVIAGHLDSTTGPAVFFKLEDLKPGDEIFTISGDGQEFRFVVTASEVYAEADAPLERIFGTAVRPQLNLITCDGAFDQSQREYDKRLVVYSELATGS